MLDSGGTVLSFPNSPPAICTQTHTHEAHVALCASSSRTNANPFPVAEGEESAQKDGVIRVACLCFSLIDFALMFLALANRVRPKWKNGELLRSYHTVLVINAGSRSSL